MTRKTSQTVTETITCDICGKTWDEEIHGFSKNKGLKEDDLCDECQEAYNTWKAERRKATYKISQ